MLKRFFLSLALTAGLLSPSFAAGTIPISLTQRFDNTTHLPLAAGQIYFIQAGTTSTPQNAFQDSALTLPYANPLTLDAGGDIPQLFFADGSIKIRITNALGVQQIVQDNILVIGPSSGGGGGSSVDATTILATGDIKVTYGTGVLSGFVRANGRTIGSATSGAIERANSDTQALFLYLWGADANLAVSTGRGVSAAADWAANKTITLPDMRGRVIAGLDDMGNSAASRLTSTYFGTTTTTLGAASTTTDHTTLGTTNLPPYTPSGSVSTTTSLFLSGVVGTTTGGTTTGGQSAPIGTATNNGTATSTSTFTGTAQGGTSTPFANVQPTILTTFYIKL